MGARVGLNPIKIQVEGGTASVLPRLEEVKKAAKGFAFNVNAAAFVPGPMKQLRAMFASEDVLSRHARVKQFARAHLTQGSFSIKGIQRAVAKEFLARTGVADNRPDGTDVRSMFDEKMFQSGSTRVASRLKPDKMKQLHCNSCDLCRDHYATFEACHKGCYYNLMDRCITHGWNAGVDRRKILPIYRVHNSKNLGKFNSQATGEKDAMLSDEVLVRLDSFLPGVHTLNALGAVLKNADVMRARTLVHIDIIDETTLLAASRALVDQGFLKIKVRITIDCSGSGVNGAAYSPSFRMPSFQEALKKVYRDCFMSKADVSRYFHSFPISEEFQNLLVVEFEPNVFYK